MNQDRLKYLFSQYFRNSITQVELRELFAAIAIVDSDRLTAIIEETIAEQPTELANLPYNFDKESVYHKIKAEIANKKAKRLPKQKRAFIMAAAVLLVFSLIGLSIYVASEKQSLEQIADINLPEQNQAFIRFSDGQTFVLNNTPTDSLRARGIARTLQSNGDWSFTIHPTAATKNMKQTFYSPKGNSSQIVLSDGTKVWLNSGSQISYPTAFTQTERTVSLQGEAYFDVIHDAKIPFFVQAENTKIKVLGTQFNIATNLIPKKVFTTLIAGSVEVNSPVKGTIISPGTQAETDNSTGALSTHPINIKDILAWKEGYFRFKDDDIHQVLSKIKAWYAIEDYEVQEETIDRFTGSILRTRKLSDLLNQLEKISNYKFKIIDGRIIVMK